MNATQEMVEKDNEILVEVKIEGVNMQSLHDFMVLVHNNTHTDAMKVVGTLKAFCGYTEEQAVHYTLKVHHLGKAVVFWGKQSECDGLASELGKIAVKAETIKNE